MQTEGSVDIGEMFRLGTPIDEAIAQAGRDAIREHQQTGIPLVYCRDDKSIFVNPYTMEEVPTLNPVPRPIT